MNSKAHQNFMDRFQWPATVPGTALGFNVTASKADRHEHGDAYWLDGWVFNRGVFVWAYSEPPRQNTHEGYASFRIHTPSGRSFYIHEPVSRLTKTALLARAHAIARKVGRRWLRPHRGCPRHPSYAVKRRPTANCTTCRRLWAEKRKRDRQWVVMEGG